MNARDWISKLVSNPRVFEVQTKLLGGDRMQQELIPLARRATGSRTAGRVIDVGGGTASARSVWPDGWSYISIDPDPRLVTFNSSDETMQKLVGDASRLGLRDNSVDVVFMKNVSHHLDDEKWPKALSEIERVLKPDGCFVFVDATWTQRRLISRLAWAVDAGRFPRPSQSIESAIAARFDIEYLKRMTLVHHAILLTSRPRPALSGADQSVT
jgi:SAM-dependent methyltransferase